MARSPAASRRRRFLEVAAVVLASTTLALAGWLPSAPADAAGCPSAGGGSMPGLAPANEDPEYVTFRGRGWGHGVGMSQYGAKGAAELGCTAEQILTTYYTGTRVTTSSPATPIRVGISWDWSSRTVATGSASVTWNCGSGCSMTQPPNTSWTVRAGGGGLTVQDRTVDSMTASLGSLGDGRTLRVDGGSYDLGTMELSADSGGRGDAVVALPLEQYVYGIAEVPASWPTETLRTQAIAARTYAQLRMGSSYANCGCHVYDTTSSQVYRGSGYDSRWMAAVDATRSRVVTHNGGLIDAVYSSSHGGHSTSSAFVWGSSRGYLQPVDDSRWEAASGNPLMRWSVAVDRDVLGDRLGIGRVIMVRVNEPTGHGSPPRVGNPAYGYGGVTFVGTGGTKTVSGEYVRSMLGSFGQLASSLFTVAYPVQDEDPGDEQTTEPDPGPPDGGGGGSESETEAGSETEGDGGGGGATEEETTSDDGASEDASSTESESADDEATEEAPASESEQPSEPDGTETATDDGGTPGVDTIVGESDGETGTASPPPGDQGGGPSVVSDQQGGVAGTGGNGLHAHEVAAAPDDPVEPAPEPTGAGLDRPAEPGPDSPAPEDADDSGEVDFAALYERRPQVEDVTAPPPTPLDAAADAPPSGVTFDAMPVVLPVEIPWWDQLPVSPREMAMGASVLTLAMVGGGWTRRRIRARA